MSNAAERRAEDVARLCTLGAESFTLARSLTWGSKDPYDSWGSMAVGIDEPWINLQLIHEDTPNIHLRRKRIKSLMLDPKGSGYLLMFIGWGTERGCHYTFDQEDGLVRFIEQNGTKPISAKRIATGEREVIAQAMMLLRDRLQEIWDQPVAAQ